MCQGKLQGRRRQPNVELVADLLDAAGPLQDLRSRCLIGVRRALDRSRGQDARREWRADDDSDAALAAGFELRLERALVEERVWHGDQKEVELEALEEVLHHAVVVDPRADASNLAPALQLLERAVATPFEHTSV